MSLLIPITIAIALVLVWGGILASIQPQGDTAKAFYIRVFLFSVWLFGCILLVASFL